MHQRQFDPARRIIVTSKTQPPFLPPVKRRFGALGRKTSFSDKIIAAALLRARLICGSGRQDGLQAKEKRKKNNEKTNNSSNNNNNVTNNSPFSPLALAARQTTNPASSPSTTDKQFVCRRCNRCQLSRGLVWWRLRDAFRPAIDHRDCWEEF